MKAKHVQESCLSDRDEDHKKQDKKHKSWPKKKKTKYVVVDSDMLLSSDSSSVVSMEPEIMLAKVKKQKKSASPDDIKHKKLNGECTEDECNSVKMERESKKHSKTTHNIKKQHRSPCASDIKTDIEEVGKILRKKKRKTKVKVQVSDTGMDTTISSDNESVKVKQKHHKHYKKSPGEKGKQPAKMSIDVDKWKAVMEQLKNTSIG